MVFKSRLVLNLNLSEYLLAYYYENVNDTMTSCEPAEQRDALHSYPLHRLEYRSDIGNQMKVILLK